MAEMGLPAPEEKPLEGEKATTGDQQEEGEKKEVVQGSQEEMKETG